MLSIHAQVSSEKPETRRIRSVDGAQIAYRVTARAPQGAPRVVLAGPLGLPARALEPLCAPLTERHQLLTWDYRGLYGSGPPRRGTTQPFGVSRQSSDLLSILQAERWGRVSLIGWGIGAQIALDFARIAGDRVQKLALLCGGPPASAAAQIGVRRLALRFLDRLTREDATRRAAARWCKRLGLVGDGVDESTLLDLAEAYAAQPAAVLRETAEAARTHDLAGALGTIDARTLVIAGDRDPLVPKAAAQQMVRALPRAELLIVRGGSHLAPLEYPELVQLRLAAFFAESGLDT